jgi:hypothetical protein
MGERGDIIKTMHREMASKATTQPISVLLTRSRTKSAVAVSLGSLTAAMVTTAHTGCSTPSQVSKGQASKVARAILSANNREALKDMMKEGMGSTA